MNTPDDWSDIQISQHPEGDIYRYEVKVNGVVVASIVNSNPQEFAEVSMYASDSQSTAQGDIQRLNIVPVFEG